MHLTFAKHETFYIREGWLFKGMAAIQHMEDGEDLPTIFLDRDAPERLGIGRNMVHALRYWMQATGLTEEQFEGRAVQRLTPSFGEIVWQYDRYLENEGTLWLIHYHLVCNRELATSWYWFFNHYVPTSFTDKQALESLQHWVVTAEPERRVARGSLKKDVTCLLRTYLPDNRAKTPEYLRESPLAQLGIMLEFGEGSQKRYHLQRVDGSRLHPLITLYVMLDRQKKERENSSEVRLSEILQEPMNVGRVFNVTTAVLTDLIATLNKNYPDMGIRFVRTAGLDQLTLPTIEPEEVLHEYYEETAS